MRVVTIVSLGACAVFGLAALVVAKTMLPNAATAKVAAPQAVGVPVVAARSPLKFGDRLDASKVEIVQLPKDAVPEGAFTTVAQVLSQDGGGPPVVLTAIAAREPLLPAKLSGPGARASVAAEIRDGFRAYTIKVSDVTGVGGHALPGDWVDVVLMRDVSPPQSQTHNYVSQVVLQDVRVLGVDLNADLASNKPASPTTATLEVTIPDAQKLSVAGDLGKLSLALRKTGATEVAQTSPIRTSSFVGGGGEAPRARRVARASVAAPAGPRLIEVVASETKGGSRSKPAKTAPAAPTPAPAPQAATPQSDSPTGFSPSTKPA
ncbi:MAG TPA: Flp pilus assembly protein CpaB [Phenylobacterium sp.]|jgi:pilus assembly protein CpaB